MPGSVSGDHLLCDTPSQRSGAHGLAVSPNAQQFSPPALFAYYPPPIISHSSPATGPAAGGTVVVVHGSGIAPAVPGGACDVTCRFGDLLVPASADADAATVTCLSPANPAAEGVPLPLSVSPNRQDYSGGRRAPHMAHSPTPCASP